MKTKYIVLIVIGVIIVLCIIFIAPPSFDSPTYSLWQKWTNKVPQAPQVVTPGVQTVSGDLPGDIKLSQQGIYYTLQPNGQWTNTPQNIANLLGISKEIPMNIINSQVGGQKYTIGNNTYMYAKYIVPINGMNGNSQPFNITTWMELPAKLQLAPNQQMVSY